MKPIFNSKTVWFNVFTAAVAILAIIPQFVQSVGISPEAAKIIVEVDVFVSTVINIILRVFYTSAPIEK